MKAWIDRARLSQRAGVAAAAIALHIPFVAGLLYFDLAGGVSRIEPPAAREIEMVLPLPQRAAPSTAPRQGAEQRGIGTPPVYFNPDTPIPSVLPQAGAVGRALIGCQPENWRDWSEEERRRCAKVSGVNVAALRDSLPRHIKLPGETEKYRNSDFAARERATVDYCMAAKGTGTECIHELLYGKDLPKP